MSFLFQEGERIDKYIVERCLGTGGMGAVYLVRHIQLNALRAIKVLHPEAEDDPEFRERFIREAKFAAKVQHPNIVSVLDVELNSTTNFSYIVMEYIEGHTIEQLLKAGALQAVFIVRETARALAFVAESGIVHRDIKPANIMITKEGQVKVADLGIAKYLDPAGGQSHTLTLENTMIGTPAYASPEQCRDARSVDIRSDIYSLGATLYEMLSGVCPFSGTNAFDIMAKVLRMEPPPLLQLKPEITPELADLVHKMMQKDPAKRPQDMLDLLELLNLFELPDKDTEMTPMLKKLLEQKAEELAQTRVSEILQTTRKSRRIKFFFIASMTVILLAIILVLWLSPGADGETTAQLKQELQLQEEQQKKLEKKEKKQLEELARKKAEAEEQQKKLKEEKLALQKKLDESNVADEQLKLKIAEGRKKIEEDKKRGIKFNSSGTVLVSYPKNLPESSYEIPYGITSITEGAFLKNHTLKHIKIPETVTKIESYAFNQCFKLTDINIPNSVKKIGTAAFGGCYNLKRIEIPNSVTQIGSSLFFACVKLESIKIPNTVTKIGAEAFTGCSNLKRIEIPNSVTSIGGYAFSNCKSLTSINIPDSVTNIQERVFLKCINLKKIRIPKRFTDKQIETWELPRACEVERY